MMELLEQINKELQNKAQLEPHSFSKGKTTMTEQSLQETNKTPVLERTGNSVNISVTKYMTEITRYPDGREFIKCWLIQQDYKDYKKKKEKKVLKEVNVTKCEEEVY